MAVKQVTNKSVHHQYRFTMVAAISGLYSRLINNDGC